MSDNSSENNESYLRLIKEVAELKLETNEKPAEMPKEKTRVSISSGKKTIYSGDAHINELSILIKEDVKGKTLQKTKEIDRLISFFRNFNYWITLDFNNLVELARQGFHCVLKNRTLIGECFSCGNVINTNCPDADFSENHKEDCQFFNGESDNVEMVPSLRVKIGRIVKKFKNPENVQSTSSSRSSPYPSDRSHRLPQQNMQQLTQKATQSQELPSTSHLGNIPSSSNSRSGQISIKEPLVRPHQNVQSPAQRTTQLHEQPSTSRETRPSRVKEFPSSSRSKPRGSANIETHPTSNQTLSQTEIPPQPSTELSTPSKPRTSDPETQLPSDSEDDEEDEDLYSAAGGTEDVPKAPDVEGSLLSLPSVPQQPAPYQVLQRSAEQETPISPHHRIARAPGSSSSQMSSSSHFPNRTTDIELGIPMYEKMENPVNRIMSFNDSQWRYEKRTRNIQAADKDFGLCGFFYNGVKDRITCFYCGGTLENIESNDHPHIIHMTNFPNCDYMIQKYGCEYIADVTSRSRVRAQPLPRDNLKQVEHEPEELPPPIPPRNEEHHRQQLLNEAMQQEHVKKVINSYRFPEQQVKDVIWKKILEEECYYESAEALLNVLSPDVDDRREEEEEVQFAPPPPSQHTREWVSRHATSRSGRSRTSSGTSSHPGEASSTMSYPSRAPLSYTQHRRYYPPSTAVTYPRPGERINPRPSEFTQPLTPISARSRKSSFTNYTANIHPRSRPTSTSRSPITPRDPNYLRSLYSPIYAQSEPPRVEPHEAITPPNSFLPEIEPQDYHPSGNPGERQVFRDLPVPG